MRNYAKKGKPTSHTPPTTATSAPRPAPQPAPSKSALEEFLWKCQSRKLEDGTYAIIQYGDRDATSVVIPEGVSEVPISAFRECVKLTSLIFPASMKQYRSDLVDFPNLSTLSVVPGNPNYHSSGNCIIETLSKSLVLGCKTSVIPADGSVSTIKTWAFRQTPANIIIPRGVATIENYAICCKTVTSIQISDTVTQLDALSFYDRNILTAVSVAPGNSTFYSDNNCLIRSDSKKLIIGCVNSVIPSGGDVSIIGERAFHCAPPNIIIPHGVITLEAQVFPLAGASCRIVLSATVTNISPRAFPSSWTVSELTIDRGNPRYYSRDMCIVDKTTGTVIKGFTNSQIPSDPSITVLSDYAYYGAHTEKITIPKYIKRIGNQCFSCSSSIKSIEFQSPSQLIQIGDQAFQYCTIQRICIPKSVVNIGKSLFENCHSLTNLSIQFGNPVYYSNNNCIIEDATSKLIGKAPKASLPTDGCIRIIGRYACAYSQSNSVTIPEGVEKIETEAFYSNYYLSSVNIAGTVTEIENYAFNWCNNLKKVTVPAQCKVHPNAFPSGCVVYRA